MITSSTYITRFHDLIPGDLYPWDIPENLEVLIADKMRYLGADYTISGLTAIHKTATIEQGVVLKGPIFAGPGCFIGAHAYLRGGVYLEGNCIIGPGCEVKSSLIFRNTALAHFNFVGDSVLGEGVNLEAGSIIANHYNERSDKTIHVNIEGIRTVIPATKFGALVGDHSRIGANAVLSPGTLLKSGSIVDRLQLIPPA